MSKKQVLFIIILSVIFSWLFSVFIGGFLLAKISTWPLLNRWHILSPEAPIVITNHETVRVSDSGDILQASENIKSKISAVFLAGPGGNIVSGSAINLTSDGDFVTGNSTFSQSDGNYFVILDDGRTAPILARVQDPATSLIFFKANLNNVPVANFTVSANAQVGDQILFAAHSAQSFMETIVPAIINFSQSDIQGRLYQSDYPSSSFGAAASSTLLSGEAIVNANGDILGIWNGGNIISSDVLKQAMNLYLSGAQKINRPSFGFSYQIITQNESTITGQPQGALIKAISAGPGKQAGLEIADVITQVGGSPISETTGLEGILQNFKPGDKMPLTVERKNQILNLTLTVGELP